MAAMKKRLDKYASRMNEGEKELVWRRINAGNQQESRRKRQFWTALGASGSLVAAGLILVVMLSGEDLEKRVDEIKLAPVVEVVEAESALAPVEDDKIMAAAPAAPEDDPTVASSKKARRGGAAVLRNGERAVPVAELTLDSQIEEMTVLALTEAGVDSSGSWVHVTAAGAYARIYGKVMREGGDPLPFANVVLEGTNYGAMTLDDGSFDFLVPPGTYDLVVSFMGYQPARIEGLAAHSDLPAVERFAMHASTALEMETVLVEGQRPKADVKSSSVVKKRAVDAPGAFAVDNVQEAMALEAGITMKGGQLHVRGGRSSEVSMMAHGVPVNDATTFFEEGRGTPRNRRHGCWIPPYWSHPNGEPFDAMYFEHYGTNPFIVTDEDALSTFAVDVDEASYTLTRRYIEDGHLPPAAAVRVEEFVNYFDTGYGRVRGGDFALRADGAPSPFGDGYHLLRLGVQAREIPRRERKPANLIFVIDTSGSMGRENRLGLVKRALGILLDELEQSDTVGIVEYGSRGREVLRPTSVEDRRQIERAIESLHTNGSTNAEEGLELGYNMASRIYDESSINRIILCSDGVANTGETRAEKILDRVRYESDRGIHLSAVGFGMGNYNDMLMEKLADNGDGNYHYVDQIDEAERVFRENLTGMLQTVARDVKIQVEFDPESVLRWRLLGYENRDVADEDFRSDSVDAGEIGAGHTVVALYEVKLSDEALRVWERRRSRREFSLGEFRLRYEYPAGHEQAGEVKEISRSLRSEDLGDRFDQADAHFRLAALGAECAEILRGSYWARDSQLDDLREMTEEIASDLRAGDQYREFLRLLERAARIEAGENRD
jgi:Ca-activated chloride channel homolog